MKKFILLDWDGNLAKTLNIWLNAFRTVLEKRDIKLTDKEIATSFGATVKYLELWGVKDIENACEEADRIAKQGLPNVELYPDALVVIESLFERGKKLALITSSTHENVQHILKRYNIDKYFLAVIAADDIKNHKPHPEALEKALQKLGGTKEEAIMIGDSDKDIGAANNFGIESILFYPPEHARFHSLKKLKTLNPTYIVYDFRQILKIV